MNENRITSKFFKKNPLQNMSAAMIAHYAIRLYQNKEEHLIADEEGKRIDDARRKAIELEHIRIEQMEEPEELVECARKGCDPFNHNFLCDKIIARSEETMPYLLKRYRTCALDGFIDMACCILASTDPKYAQQLLEMYNQIRCPYAKACACLVFGMQGMKETVSMLLKEYDRFLDEYPKESFEQHPLMALYILHGKY